jgi:hypothetical protein
MITDPLLPALFPPSETPEPAHILGLCKEALARQQEAIQEGRYQPSPGRRLQPTPATPLAIRGVSLVSLELPEGSSAGSERLSGLAWLYRLPHTNLTKQRCICTAAGQVCG